MNASMLTSDLERMVRWTEKKFAHPYNNNIAPRPCGYNNILSLTSYLFEPHDRKDEIAEFFGGLDGRCVFHPKIQLNSNLALDGNAEFLFDKHNQFTFLCLESGSLTGWILK